MSTYGNLKDDEVVLWRSAAVDAIPSGNPADAPPPAIVMIALKYTHSCSNRSESVEKAFSVSAVRLDWRTGWLQMAYDLLRNNPGEVFRTSMIGLSGDYSLRYSGRVFLRYDFGRWLEKKLGKVVTLDTMLRQNVGRSAFATRYANPFPDNVKFKYFTLDEPWNMPLTTKGWFETETRPAKKRKGYGRVIQ